MDGLTAKEGVRMFTTLIECDRKKDTADTVQGIYVLTYPKDHPGRPLWVGKTTTGIFKTLRKHLHCSDYVGMLLAMRGHAPGNLIVEYYTFSECERLKQELGLMTLDQVTAHLRQSLKPILNSR